MNTETVTSLCYSWFVLEEELGNEESKQSFKMNYFAFGGSKAIRSSIVSAHRAEITQRADAKLNIPPGPHHFKKQDNTNKQIEIKMKPKHTHTHKTTKKTINQLK